jgi:hypothetical protein
MATKPNKAATPQRFFKSPIRAGDPVSKAGFVEGVMAMAKALENIEIVGGHIEWRNGTLRIVIDD